MSCVLLWSYGAAALNRRARRSVAGGRMVGIVECAVIADQFGLCEGGRLLVAILRSGYEGLERVQRLHAGRGALIGV